MIRVLKAAIATIIALRVRDLGLDSLPTVHDLSHFGAGNVNHFTDWFLDWERHAVQQDTGLPTGPGLLDAGGRPSAFARTTRPWSPQSEYFLELSSGATAFPIEEALEASRDRRGNPLEPVVRDRVRGFLEAQASRMSEVYGVRPFQVGFGTVDSAGQPSSPFVREPSVPFVRGGEVMVRLEGFVWRTARPGTVELRLFRNEPDDWLSSESLGPGIGDAGYGMISTEGFALDPALLQPLGTIPLYTWLSISRRDHLTSADDTRFLEGATRTLYGERWRPVSSIDPDYVPDRLEGYIYPPDRPAPAGTIPLVRWMDREGAHFTTRTEDIPWLSGAVPLEVETGRFI